MPAESEPGVLLLYAIGVICLLLLTRDKKSEDSSE